MYLSSENKNGLNQRQAVSWRLTTSSHLLIELVLPLNPTSLSQSTHSRNSLKLKHSHISFASGKLFLPICFLTALFISALHFFLACINHCYSTLMPLTDIHSHRNLTIFTLYPICTLRDRIQISWLFDVYIAIIMSKPKQKQRHVTNTRPPPKQQLTWSQCCTSVLVILHLLYICRCGLKNFLSLYLVFNPFTRI